MNDTTAGGFAYLSVCSGIEAMSLAVHDRGWKAVAFSEIESFPCAVLAHHWPDVPNLGDMTKYEEWKIEWPQGARRVLAGGTPCQAFSVAGGRRGLADGRGNLSLTFCEVADREEADWVLWENVPGVLSMHDNAFGCFLGRLCGADAAIEPPGRDGRWPGGGVVSGPKRTAAWRVLDAQYFGVAQRRRRVFVLAVPGAGNWRCAAALFPVSDGVRWDPASRGEAREGVAGVAAKGAGGGGEGDDGARGGCIVSHDPACTLTAREYKGPLPEADLSAVVAHTLRGEGFDASEDGTGRGTPLVAAPLTTKPYADNEAQESRLVVATLTSHYATHYGRQAGFNGGVAENQLLPVAFSGRARGDDGRGYAREEHIDGDIVGSLDTVKPPRVGGDAFGVRRLTPRECERLQGVPDDYTAIEVRGKPAADGPRYRALGNSWAVPVIRWLARRMEFVEANY